MAVRRIVLILLWILSLVGITYYGGPVSYGFFAAVTLVPFISLLYTLIVLIRFKIYQDVNRKNVVAGSISDFYITLQNEDIFTYSGIRITFYSPFSTISGMDENAEYELPPHSGIKKETSLFCRYRGEYEVGVKKIIIRDYLGIFRLTFKNREPFRVNVLPAVYTPAVLKTLENIDSASVDSLGGNTEPDVTVRDYVPGDDIRKIHWKLTAANGKLLVRNTTGEEKQGIGIIMDPERYSQDPADYLPLENKITETVIALLRFFLAGNTPVSAYTYQTFLRSDLIKDEDAFKEFYTFLSGYRFEKDTPAKAMFSQLVSEGTLFSRKIVIAVLHTLSAEAIETIRLTELNGVTVIVYLITDDEHETENARTMLHGKFFRIGTEEDLKEVL
ncbi:MAG: DUF58 domain-containing protein [Lachnospiraceae bacterium]|nr:DUF58 domain-containing protein [Lachnospiraceae bacterium]